MARGHFSEYPYINFTDYNYDWLLKTVRRLVKDWKDYNETWDNWQEGIEKDFADLKTYVINYFENLDIEEEVKKQVTEQVTEILTDEFVISILNNYIAQMPRTVRGDVVLNLPSDAPYINDGACYIGNNRVVVYFSSDTDVGKLECYDIVEKSKLWSYDIEGYHGNSLTYFNNQIYICGAYSQNDTSTLIPTVVVVDLNNPSQVAGVLTPAVSGLYSLTYGDGYFYGITHRGTTEGEANKVTVFDEEFNIVRTMDLPEYPAVQGFSTQGISCYRENILYGVDYTNSAIFGYDATTGEKVFQANVEEYFNNYRYVGELESVVFDFDNEEFYITNRSFNTGEANTRLGSIVRVGLYKNISAKKVVPEGTAVTTGESNTAVIRVRFNQKSLTPALTPNFFNISDAINLAKNSKQACNIILYADENFNGLSCIIRDFTGAIIGADATNKIKTSNVLIEGCNLILQNLSFNGESSRQIYYGTFTGSVIISNSSVKLRLCAWELGTVNVVNSIVNEIATNGVKYNLVNSTLERLTHNVDCDITANATSRVIARLWAGGVTSGNTYQTSLKGQSFTLLALNGNINAYVNISGNYTKLNYTFNSSNNNLTLTDGTNTFVVNLNTTTGMMSVIEGSGSLTIDLL